MTRPPRRCCVLIGLLGVAGWPDVSTARARVAAVSGTVTDTSGAVIAGARIVLTEDAAGTTRVAVTRQDGGYQVETVGRTILDKPPGAWEQYGPYIIGGSLFVLLQSTLIAALLVQRRRRVHVERALHESEERFRLMADAAPVLVWRADTDRQSDYFNRPWLEFTGRTMEQELGEGWAEGVWPGDLDRCLHTYFSAFDARQPFRMEYRLRRADGLYRWVQDTGVPRYGSDNSFAGYIGSCLDISDRKEAEDALRKNQHVAGLLIAAQDAERARIARDLHDDVSQQLAALSIALSSLKRHAHDADLQHEVSSIQQRAGALAESVRDLSHDLHPDVLKHAGLTAALSTHCAGLSRSGAIAVNFTTDGDFESFDSETAFCWYRIAQELLHHVVTHTGARQAEVRLLRTGDGAELTIADDGRGVDVAETRKSGAGLGLVSINERVRLCGGTLTVMTERNKGTQVRVWLPTSPRAKPDAGDASGRDATT